MGKDSVLIYVTITYDLIEGLTDEQRGKILTAILCDKKGEPLPDMDTVTCYVYSTIKKHIDRNEEAYADTCEKRRIAGKAGANKRWGDAPNKENGNQTIANDSKCYQMLPNDSKCYKTIANDSKNGKMPKTIAKIADNDNENDNENDNDNYLKEKRNNSISIKKEKSALSEKDGLTAAQRKKATKREFTPPTLDEVRAYAEQRGREDLAEKFFDFFDAGNWHDSNGTPVISWKQKFVTWEQHNPKKAPLYTTGKFYVAEG